ncbi:MAG: hypothetical protein ACE367_25220 [Acidimicrobiales bacterium]
MRGPFFGASSVLVVLVVLAVIAALLVAPASPASASASTPDELEGYPRTQADRSAIENQIADEVFATVNAERAARGLEPFARYDVDASAEDNVQLSTWWFRASGKHWSEVDPEGSIVSRNQHYYFERGNFYAKELLTGGRVAANVVRNFIGSDRGHNQALFGDGDYLAIGIICGSNGLSFGVALHIVTDAPRSVPSAPFAPSPNPTRSQPGTSCDGSTVGPDDPIFVPSPSDPTPDRPARLPRPHGPAAWLHGTSLQVLDVPVAVFDTRGRRMAARAPISVSVPRSRNAVAAQVTVTTRGATRGRLQVGTERFAARTAKQGVTFIVAVEDSSIRLRASHRSRVRVEVDALFFARSDGHVAAYEAESESLRSRVARPQWTTPDFAPTTRHVIVAVEAATRRHASTVQVSAPGVAGTLRVPVGRTDGRTLVLARVATGDGASEGQVSVRSGPAVTGTAVVAATVAR